VAFGQNLGFNVIGIEVGHREGLALEPLLHHALLVLHCAQVAEDGLEHIVNVHLSVEGGEASGGKQEVVEEARA
jgi:hypothetical protein